MSARCASTTTRTSIPSHSELLYVCYGSCTPAARATGPKHTGTTGDFGETKRGSRSETLIVSQKSPAAKLGMIPTSPSPSGLVKWLSCQLCTLVISVRLRESHNHFVENSAFGRVFSKMIVILSSSPEITTMQDLCASAAVRALRARPLPKHTSPTGMCGVRVGTCRAHRLAARARWPNMYPLHTSGFVWPTSGPCPSGPSLSGPTNPK